MSHFAHSTPVARKPHRCQMCTRIIEPGETYRRSAGMDGSTAWTWKECAHCAAFVRVAYRRSWMDEGYDDDLLADFVPESVTEARVRAQYRRRWRGRDGGLYPIPDVQWAEDKDGFRYPIGIVPGVLVAAKGGAS